MGKIIGFLIGLMVAGPLGAFLGIVVGHFFDKGRSRIYHEFNPHRRAEVEHTFFRTVFCLMGYLAKSDGRISEAEISDTEQLMSRMRLKPDERQRAIALFKEGSTAGFDVAGLLDTFNRECGRFSNLKQILLIYLISLALADGAITDTERRVLEDVAQALGYSTATFNQILRMAMAQNHFYRYGQSGFGHGGGGSQGQDQGQYQRQRYQPPPSRDELATAYEALGVEPDISDTELKKAYRKLMSQYHPDKLSGQGIPQDMIEVATERAQEIQSAYDLIKKKRNMR